MPSANDDQMEYTVLDSEVPDDSQRIESLKWGNLRIIQDQKLPRFSLDAVLLADFVDLAQNGKIADLGAGTGIITLLLHARSPLSRIFAIELVPQMAKLAQKSMEINNLSGQIEVIQGDLCQAGALLEKGAFDLVICNPPYGENGTGRISSDPIRAAARTEIYCRLEDVIREGAALLKDNGHLALCHRPARLQETLSIFSNHKIVPIRLRLVQPFADAAPEHFLIEGVKGAEGQLDILPSLILYQSPGCYSEEAKMIFEGRNCVAN